MKVRVRVTGDGLARAEALVSDIRRRAIERLQARAAERRETERRRVPAASSQQDPTER